MPEAEGGGIFVSYRRHESSHLAGRLYDRLADRFGEGQVFIDVDTIEPGVDFAEEISRAVATCKVLLAVIGPARRLDDPDDIVRLEIEAALARDVRVIPILVEGAVMPGRQDLPESLAGLARRNALLIRHESFRYDAGRLVTAIERVLAASPSTGAVPQSPSTTDAAALIVPDAHNVQPDGNALGEAVQEGRNLSETTERVSSGLSAMRNASPSPSPTSAGRHWHWPRSRRRWQLFTADRRKRSQHPDHLIR